MNKEAREKLYNDLRAINETDWQDYVDAVIGVMEANGYRKLPKDKPPLLTYHKRQKAMERARDRHANESPIYSFWDYITDEVAQAQREADIKHYEG